MDNNELQGVSTPIENGQPVTPVTPVEPVAPVAPVASQAPAAPVQPVAPVAPVTPVAPVAPQAPVAPVAPVQPVAPVVPETPVQPVAPAAPAAPTPEAPQGEKKKSMLPIILVIVVALIAIGVGGFFVYRANASKPKKIVDSSIDLLFSKSETFKKELKERLKFDYKTQTVSNSGTISLNFTGSTGDYASLAEMGKVTVAYDTVVSVPSKKFSVGLRYLEDDKNIIGGDLFYKENKIYLQSTDLINQVYFVNLPKEIDLDKFLEENIKSVSYDNYDKIIKKLETYVQKSIKEDYLKQENGTYKVDGQEIKGLKTSIDVTPARAIDMADDIIDFALDDDEFIKLVSEVSNTPETKVREELTESKKKNEESLKKATGDVLATVNIYSTDMGKYLALEIIAKNKTVLTSVEKDDVNTIKLYTEQYDFGSLEDQTDCIGGGDDTDCLEPSTQAPEKKEVVYVLTIDNKSNTATLTLSEKETIKIIKTTNGYKFDANLDGLTVSGEFTDEMSDGKEKMSLNGSVGFDKFKGNLEFKQTVSTTDKVKEMDTSSAKDFEKLSEADLELIDVNLEKKIKSSKVLNMIYQSIEQQMEMMNQYDDYELEDDDFDF